eukprot:SAG11_NODE_903_length_6619_cov_31.037270_1_plen_163_part_00
MGNASDRPKMQPPTLASALLAPASVSGIKLSPFSTAWTAPSLAFRVLNRYDSMQLMQFDGRQVRSCGSTAGGLSRPALGCSPTFACADKCSAVSWENCRLLLLCLTWRPSPSPNRCYAISLVRMFVPFQAIDLRPSFRVKFTRLGPWYGTIRSALEPKERMQ